MTVIARGIMILVLYPFLVRSGYSFNSKLYFLMNVSAVRGAVCLCGAFILSITSTFPSA